MHIDLWDNTYDNPNAEYYSQELIIVWLWSGNTFEPRVYAADTLVLKKRFEDHADHVFIDIELRSGYLDMQEDIIPGNTVKFVGKVVSLDTAVGNYWYDITNVYELIKTWTPTQETVEELIKQYSYCETDDDCAAIEWKCPLPCHIAINAKYQETVEQIINNFRNNQETQCTYKCMEIASVSCNSKSMCEVK